MLDNAGSFFVLNGGVEPVDGLDSVGLDKKSVVYEVIRIIDRVPLFLEDHYFRLVNSMKLTGYELELSMQGLKKQIQETVDANGLTNCNVKVNVYVDSDNQKFLHYISKSHYPGIEEIERGVPVSLLEWERKDPNVKIINHIYKEAVSKKMSETKAFELLLVNNGGRITEGSRSNVFFVKGSKVFTAPGEYVLKGITRQYIIDVCENLGFEVIETLVNLNSLNDIEGVFISGTSIKVLPVSNIDEKLYKSSTHPSIISIRNAFDGLIDEYVAARRG